MLPPAVPVDRQRWSPSLAARFLAHAALAIGSSGLAVAVPSRLHAFLFGDFFAVTAGDLRWFTSAAARLAACALWRRLPHSVHETLRGGGRRHRSRHSCSCWAALFWRSPSDRRLSAAIAFLITAAAARRWRRRPSIWPVRAASSSASSPAAFLSSRSLRRRPSIGYAGRGFLCVHFPAVLRRSASGVPDPCIVLDVFPLPCRGGVIGGEKCERRSSVSPHRPSPPGRGGIATLRVDFAASPAIIMTTIKGGVRFRCQFAKQRRASIPVDVGASSSAATRHRRAVDDQHRHGRH